MSEPSRLPPHAPAAIVLVAVALTLAACTGTTTPSSTPAGSPVVSPSAPIGSSTPSPTPSASAVPTASPSGSGAYAGTDWTATALSVRYEVGQRFVFHCPPAGSPGVVWGTDAYTADSSVCTAAVHAGQITFAQGGDVTIEIRAGEESYSGTERNGVSSLSYSAYDASYVFVGEGTAPSPGTSPSASPSAGLVEQFNDSFSTVGAWGVGAVGDNEIAYANGALELRMSETDNSIWSRREFPDGPFSAARIEGDISVDAEGVAGLLCGAADDEFHGMLLSTDGRWFAVRTGGTAGGLTVLGNGPVEPSVFVVGETLRFAIGCSVLDGELTMALSAGEPSTHVAAFSGETTIAGFDRAGVYAEALAAPYVQLLDNVVAAAGETGNSATVDELLTHVPAAYRDRCQETPPAMAEPDAVVAVVCGLEAGPGAEIVEYVQFPDAEAMDEAYLGRVDAWGASSTGANCEHGPSEGPYTVGGEEVGNLLCAPQTAGIRFDWSDNRLAILATATDFDGSYSDTYQTWQEAGPEL